jgi:putative ATP-dependent endonuclease of OLD family
MIIKRVEVKNFRSIKDAHLDFDNMTALLGRNGSGKSSFLYAIETFYDTAAPVSIEDFFNRDTDSPIEIRVVYSNLRSDEKERFHPYIRDDKLIVTKRISYENERCIQRYYSSVLQISEFAEIRAKRTKSERRSAWNQLIDEPGRLLELGTRARSADEADQFMNEYESKHPELMEPIEKEQQFFGPKNIGGGMLDNFTKYVLVPAVREASDEAIGRKGAIYQLLDMIVLRRVEARKDIQEFKSKFTEEARKLYCSENLTELSELGDSISKTLTRFAPGSELRLDWDEFEPPQVQPPAALATLVEDNFEGEISRKGHGLQRALILTLLQHLAMIIPIEEMPEEYMGEDTVSVSETHEPPQEEYIEEDTVSVSETHEPPQEEYIDKDAVSITEIHEPSPGPDLILAIEEPELYLHPSRCRYMCDLLFQLAEKPGHGLGAKNQIIYTTHSPYLVDLHLFDRIRVIRKQSSPDCVVPHTVVTHFSFSQLSQELAKICNADPASFTPESVRAHAMSVMNTIVNEGFFSDVVVVVEGPSDVGILWKLHEIMNKNWSQLGIAVVPAGGKNNIDRPTLIFRGLSIPTYFIFDADSHYKGKDNEDEKTAINRNHRYLCLANAPQDDFPNTQAHENWAVFSGNLEDELQQAVGSEEFQTIRRQVASELGYPEAPQAIKNIEGAARFIEIAYEQGKQVPILEDIINKVTLLRR